jgi:hypothetical protein
MPEGSESSVERREGRAVSEVRRNEEVLPTRRLLTGRATRFLF